MRSSFFFWTIAVLLTIGSAVYQRLTGPTYPLRGQIVLDSTAIPYAMERSYVSTEDAPVFVEVPDSSYSGVVRWRLLGSDDPWSEIPMVFVAQSVRADIPSHQPLTKLEYAVEIIRDSVSVAVIPETGSIPIRFKGYVPMWVIIPHVIAMFLSMLFSTRAGLEVFAREPSLKMLTGWTIGTLVVGGFIFGPLMSYYAFDLFWTGWPMGQDITDNKTLIALAGWVVAGFMLRKPKQARWWVLLAAVVMFGVFMIPHSV